MEFKFNVSHILPGEITIVESKESFSGLKIYDNKSNYANDKQSKTWFYNLSSNTPWDIRIKRRKEELEDIIDKIGIASAQAQNLHLPITSVKKLINSNHLRIYIIRDVKEPMSIIGMLKVGVKRLFIQDDIGAHHEVDPLCVLDFYIHESKQRCGYGHTLFNAMLEAENLSPEELAIDRPSFKCLAFLEKHYNLKEPSRQNNNFVVYQGFFSDRPVFESAISKDSSKKYQLNSGISDLESPLNSVPVIFSPRDMKSKTYYSSSENCLNWNDSERDTNHYRYKKQDALKKSSKQKGFSKKDEEKPSTDNLTPHSTSPKQYHNWQSSNCMDWCKKEKNWGVYDAMHSYSSSNDCGPKHSGNMYSNLSAQESDRDNTKINNWNQNYCSLAPVFTSSPSNQMKWNQQQSSWNILGVRPSSYSLIQKKS